jgi:hypothetical protein
MKIAPARIARVPGYRGPVPGGVWLIIELARKGGISLQSDAARHGAADVALAASLGYISVIAPDGRSFDHAWAPTAAGLHALEDHHNGQD